MGELAYSPHWGQKGPWQEASGPGTAELDLQLGTPSASLPFLPRTAVSWINLNRLLGQQLAAVTETYCLVMWSRQALNLP